jgi:hypothetical protein
MLQVLNETFEKLNVVTADWETGKELNLICEDRDRFTAAIPKTEVECIWTFGDSGSFYDSIEIEYGKIVVDKFEKQVDKWNTNFICIGEFAKYKGRIFRSYSGYTHSYWFKLTSNDETTQEMGFIMEKPGVFNKCVDRKEIEFAFASDCLCYYKSKEFYVVDADVQKQILIEPYDRDLYLEKELLRMNFEVINTKLAKWIEHVETDKIWTKTKPVFNFDKYKN